MEEDQETPASEETSHVLAPERLIEICADYSEQQKQIDILAEQRAALDQQIREKRDGLEHYRKTLAAHTKETGRIAVIMLETGEACVIPVPSPGSFNGDSVYPEFAITVTQKISP